MGTRKGTGALCYSWKISSINFPFGNRNICKMLKPSKVLCPRLFDQGLEFLKMVLVLLKKSQSYKKNNTNKSWKLFIDTFDLKQILQKVFKVMAKIEILKFEGEYFFLQFFQSKKFPFQKQLSRYVLRKRCSGNIKQIYKRTPMPKCDFSNLAYYTW